MTTSTRSLSIAFAMLALSMGALIFGLIHGETNRHREVKSLAHTFSLVWRVANIDITLSKIALKESAWDIRQAAVSLEQARQDVNALPHFLEGLESALGENALSAVARMKRTVDESVVSPAMDEKRLRATVSLLHSENATLKTLLDAYTSRLAQAPPEEASAHRYGILGLAAFITLLIGILMLQLRSHQRQLEANYLRSVGAFHAHFLQSRITAIRLFLESAAAKRRTANASLDEALEAVEELDSVQATLRKANYPAGVTTPLSEIVASVRHQYQGIEVRFEPGLSDAAVPDPQVRFMLEQMVTNAVTATERGGDPCITITARKGYNWRFWRKWIVLNVSDDGTGIGPGIVDKIIQPFFTTKSGPHNGLGLTAVSQMVQALGGSFSITSKPGNGTVASILFPI
ncbi:HAMP domain-containing histidine kinase [Salmonella enterica subsp. enterica]|jgi:signal transduction histidine kinase|nr:HAMP domain-containing histidine kinase [Salmonella enterica subsp. enterica serovar Paratyphi A]